MPRPETGASKSRVAAIIVAAGRSTRFGDGDKLFREIDGRPVIVRTIGRVHDAALVDEIVVVVGDHSLQHMRTIVRSNAWPKVRAVVPGGVRRQDSVAGGVGTFPHEAAIALPPSSGHTSAA
ncbi:MAG: IspD/TarI family cytidylyltransferase, partial [Thermomicrobiales bacterium]